MVFYLLCYYCAGTRDYTHTARRQASRKESMRPGGKRSVVYIIDLNTLTIYRFNCRFIY